MKTGMRLEDVSQLDYIIEAGFTAIELTSHILKKVQELMIQDAICKEVQKVDLVSLNVKVAELTVQELRDLVIQASAFGISLIVIETEQSKDKEALRRLLKDTAETAGGTGVKLCIENGYYLENGCCHRNGLNSGTELAEFVDSLNRDTGCDCFSAAVNTGHALLFGTNISAMIETLGKRLLIIHANDNDGSQDLHQLPYSFTVGRGSLSTEWYGMIRTLIKVHYDGLLIFDTEGLIHNIPQMVLPATLKLLFAISEEWNWQFSLEEKLKKDRTRILFGAGNMFRNYMETWGQTYPPAFVVDNNSGIWGEKKYGIEVRPPEKILSVPEEERDVWICNLHYWQIESQLEDMGIRAKWLDDKYFSEDGDRHA